MSDILIALLLLVPIFIVIAILRNASKKQKKKAQHKISTYLSQVAEEAGIVNNHQKQLIYQTVVIDEKNRKLLVIEHEGFLFSHDIYAFGDIGDIRMIHQKQTIDRAEKDRKKEHLTTKIGLEISLKKGLSKFLTFYDHMEHSIFQMAGFEKEAVELQMHIIKTKEAFK